MKLKNTFPCFCLTTANKEKTISCQSHTACTVFTLKQWHDLFNMWSCTLCIIFYAGKKVNLPHQPHVISWVIIKSNINLKTCCLLSHWNWNFFCFLKTFFFFFHILTLRFKYENFVFHHLSASISICEVTSYYSCQINVEEQNSNIAHSNIV